MNFKSTQIKPKVSAPSHSNSVNKVSMLLPKDVPNNFVKAVFYERYDKSCFRSVTCYS